MIIQKLLTKQIVFVVALFVLTTALEAQPIWHTEFPYGFGSGATTDISVYKSGYIYAAGGSLYSPGSATLSVAILDASNGALIVTNQFSFSADELAVNRIVVNKNYEAYIAGTIYDFHTPHDRNPILIKLDKHANLLWSVQFKGGQYDKAKSLILDSQDNVILGIDNNNEFEIYKLDSSGHEIWHTLHHPVNHLAYIQSRGIQLDSQDGIYAFGIAENGGNFSMYLAKFEPMNGNFDWSQQFGPSMTNPFHAFKSAFSVGNGVAIAGPIGPNGTDILVAKLSLTGQIEWQTTYPGISNFFVAGTALYYDRILQQEFVLVAGQVNSDTLGIQFDAQSGALNWASAYYPSQIMWVDHVNGDPNPGCVVDSCGNFLIPVTDGATAALLSIDHYGSATYESTNFLGHAPGGLALDQADNVYISSESQPPNFRLAVVQFPARACN